MATGKVIRIVRDRGFGFIKPDDGGPDIFFHISGVKPSRGFTFHLLRDEHPVQYDISDSPRGPRCENIVEQTEPASDTASVDLEYRDSDRRPARRR